MMLVLASQLSLTQMHHTERTFLTLASLALPLLPLRFSLRPFCAAASGAASASCTPSANTVSATCLPVRQATIKLHI